MLEVPSSGLLPTENTQDSAGLPLIYLYNRYPRLIKPTLWLGLAMNTVSLLAASWMRSVTGLVILQGIFPGMSIFGRLEYVSDKS